jgi:dihydropteroate synthase
MGSAAAAMIAVQRGVLVVRVYDVAATHDALAVWQAVHAGEAAPRVEPKPFGSQRFSDD